MVQKVGETLRLLHQMTGKNGTEKRLWIEMQIRRSINMIMDLRSGLSERRSLCVSSRKGGEEEEEEVHYPHSRNTT